MTALVRIGVFGAPVARPLDFAEAFQSLDPLAHPLEAEERDGFRSYWVQATVDGRPVRVVASVAPRHGVADAFAGVLEQADFAILLLGIAGEEEQRSALAGFGDAIARVERPHVVVANAYVPPRLEGTEPFEFAELADISGRICWWRHEKSGIDVVRRAVLLGVQAVEAIRERARSGGG